MTEQQRNILAVGSFGVTLVGVAFQFGVAWAAIVAGIVGLTVAIVLAIGAVR